MIKNFTFFCILVLMFFGAQFHNGITCSAVYTYFTGATIGLNPSGYALNTDIATITGTSIGGLGTGHFGTAIIKHLHVGLI